MKNKKDYLPISGGTGKNIETAIIINGLARENYGDVESKIVDFLASYYDKKLDLMGEKLKTEKGKYYDILYIREDIESKVGIKFKLFFDITECMEYEKK